MVKQSMKKENRFYPLISACCGLGICGLLTGFLSYYPYMMPRFRSMRSEFPRTLFESFSGFLLYLFLNLLLIGTGFPVVRFGERIRRFKGRIVFLALPLLLEMIQILVMAGRVLSEFVVACFVCSIIAALAGIYIHVYKAKAHLISFVAAVILFIPCVVYYRTGILLGRLSALNAVDMIMIVQPLMFLLPVICVIKRAVYGSDDDTEAVQNHSRELKKRADNVRKICPSCGMEQKAGNRFCVQCGQGMAADLQEERYCPQCGARLESSMLFCRECGVKL